MVVGLSAVGSTIPCLFALLPDKEKETYRRVAQLLMNAMSEVPGGMRAQSLLMDYERGLIGAFQAAFPDIEIAGCDFHWKQLIKRRIAAEGLLGLYNDDIAFQLLIRHIWSMVYIRPDDIVVAWETVIRDKLNRGLNSWDLYQKEIKAFIKYFDCQWVGELNARTKIRRKPAYPHHMWNKFEAVGATRSRTNNAMEGYNHAFSLSLPARASEWVLIDRFKAEEAMAKRTLLDRAMGQPGIEKSKSRFLQKQKLEQKLVCLVSNYDNMALSVYMEGIVAFFTD